MENDPRVRIEARQYRSLRELTVLAPPPESPNGLVPFEVPEGGMSRRRFLGILSASAALAAGSSSCSKIDRGKVIPYTKRPQEVVPGVATYYASTFQEGLTACGVLVKTREGRPIHVEGNPEHPLFGGKAPLRAVADILGLYDPDRLRGPVVDGKPADWAAATARIVPVLKDARDTSKGVLLLTGAVVSPTRRALIADLAKVVPGLRHVAWEPAVGEPERAAAKAAFGEWRIATRRFERAEVVVSLQADFLGAEADVAAIRAFAARRRAGDQTNEGGPTDAVPPTAAVSRLWTLEGGLTLTGARADHRIPVRPSRLAALAFAVARALHEKHGVALPAGVTAESLKAFDLDALTKELGGKGALLPALVEDLRRAGQAALVVAGPALPPAAHVAAHLLNGMLGAEGFTVDATRAAPPPELATTADLGRVLEEAAGGAFDAAVFWDANPAYAFPDPKAWEAAMAKIPLRVRLGLHDDETAKACQVVLPTHHWLEAWGDHEPSSGVLSLQQPTVGALHGTRQAEDLVLEAIRALAPAAQDYLAYLKARWEKEVYVPGPVPFERFWNSALHDGVLRREAKSLPPRPIRGEAVVDAAVRAAAAPPASGVEIVIAPSTALFDGRYANNGWLQEVPDPITTATWENPLAVSIADATALGVEDGDLVRIEVGGVAVEAPVVVQPGQAPGVASIALGRGRAAGSVASGVGTNVYPLVDPSSPAPFLRAGGKLSAVGRRRAIAFTQEHHRMEGRDIVRSSTLAQLAEAHDEHGEHASLYEPVAYPDHKWGMAIDLSACVGCTACVVACQSENNVPVVGPERVIRGREMHWIRIDRYYEGDTADPEVIHMPILCQHCDNAPCESVCPVNATTHSADGLNQMTYNRCVGTRYCSNNCPYKVRRYNFFDYTAAKAEPETLAFNPEVTVRPRGVMEKCSFCVQRIQDVRMRAKSEGRAVKDGEVRPACAVACPADAIVFGDLNDAGSAVARLAKSRRGYRLLEEFGAKPVITYLSRVTNPAGEGPAGKGRAGDGHGGKDPAAKGGSA